MGVGVIPGGGGTKEMARRASQAYFSGDIQLPTLKERYLNIGMAKDPDSFSFKTTPVTYTACALASEAKRFPGSGGAGPHSHPPTSDSIWHRSITRLCLNILS